MTRSRHLPDVPIFRAVPGDEAVVLGVLDRSVAWLRARGFVDQWGTTPFSASERRVAQVHGWVRAGQTLLAGSRGRPLGVLALGDAPAYVEPSGRPEVYVVLLASAHTADSSGVGRRLIRLAEDVARDRGVARVRVDCFAGNDGGLVGFYEDCGFSRVADFTVGDWPGAVLERSVAD